MPKKCGMEIGEHGKFECKKVSSPTLFTPYGLVAILYWMSLAIVVPLVLLLTLD